jgi:hypothetical protein
LLVAV